MVDLTFFNLAVLVGVRLGMWRFPTKYVTLYELSHWLIRFDIRHAQVPTERSAIRAAV